MLDVNTYERDLKDFSFSFLELPKFTKSKDDLVTMTEKWAYFFKNAAKTDEKDLDEISGDDFIIKRAYEELNRFVWSPEELRTYDGIDMKQSADKAVKAQAFDRGMEKGKTEGRIEGETEAKRAIAKALLEKGIPLSTIAETTACLKRISTSSKYLCSTYAIRYRIFKIFRSFIKWTALRYTRLTASDFSENMSRHWLPDTIQKQLRQFAQRATYLIFIGGLFYISLYGAYVYSGFAPSPFGVSDFGVSCTTESVFEWGLTFLGWSFPFFVFLHGASWVQHLFKSTPLFSKHYTFLYVLIFQIQLLIDALAHAVHYPIYYEGLIPFLLIYPVLQLIGDSLLGWLLVAGGIFGHMLYVVHTLYPLHLFSKTKEDESGELEEPVLETKSAPVIQMPKRPGPSVPQMTTVTAMSQKFELPPVALLTAPTRKTDRTNTAALQDTAKKLQQVLLEFGMKGTMGAIHPGPVVTLYEFEPAPGIKSARIIGLSSDIARSMGVISTRIAIIPGNSMMGIEIPNKSRETVFLRELIESSAFIKDSGQLTLALGQNIQGVPVMVDLAAMPHLLVAGTTGSGKSVSVNAMILSLLYRIKPEHCRMVMIDPKMLELSVYDGIPHLITPVVTDLKKRCRF